MPVTISTDIFGGGPVVGLPVGVIRGSFRTSLGYLHFINGNAFSSEMAEPFYNGCEGL